MFCPRCSQEQVSDEVRFCKGCGFALTDVAEALQHNGVVNRMVVPSTAQLKKDAVKGLAVMTLSGIFFLLSLIMGTPEPSYFVQFNMLVGILCYVFGLAWIAYTFRRKSKEAALDETSRHLNEAHRQGLDGPRAEPALRLSEPDFSNVADASVPPANQLKTKELAEREPRPPSVTERTTRLLE